MVQIHGHPIIPAARRGSLPRLPLTSPTGWDVDKLSEILSPVAYHQRHVLGRAASNLLHQIKVPVMIKLQATVKQTTSTPALSHRAKNRLQCCIWCHFSVRQDRLLLQQTGHQIFSP